jgi:hypothetical protein
LREGRALFAQGKPFHAHEVFEDAWKADASPTREFWRGLAQLAVGVTHAARGNSTGALSLLDRGAATIAPFAATQPFGVDVTAVLAWAARARDLIQDQCPVALEPPPLTRLAG